MSACLRPRLSVPITLGLIAVLSVPWSAAAADRVAAQTTVFETALAEVRTRPLAPALPSKPTARRSAQAANPALESPAFFRTRAGMVVVGVLAAGAGYAIYSAYHDRIHSPGKK